jgi:hypothetical protein
LNCLPSLLDKHVDVAIEIFQFYLKSITDNERHFKC